MHDPVTTRFLECFALLKAQGDVRSARQFAISLDVFPQSLNEILKGRREVTISILRKLCTAYKVNPIFILSGQGEPLEDISLQSPNLDIENSVPVICAHQQKLYASESIDIDTLDRWKLPEQWCGKRISMAFQYQRNHLAPSLQSGDILFCRLIATAAWRTSIVPNRIYVIVTSDAVFVERIRTVSNTDIVAYVDEAGEEQKISWDGIREVWMPQHKWSSNVEVRPQPQSQMEAFQSIIDNQNQSISQLQSTLQHIMASKSNPNALPIAGSLSVIAEGELSQVSTLS